MYLPSGSADEEIKVKMLKVMGLIIIN